AKQAIYDIRKWVTYGYDRVIDLDLKSYFDTISHELLIKLVQRRVCDPRVLRLIRRWLGGGVMHDGVREETLIGLPEGAGIWPSRRSMQRVRDKVKAILDRNTLPSLKEKLDQLNPVLRGWSAYFNWLNSAQHFRKVDQYVTFKLRRWLQAKHQRRRRAFWKTPLAYWREAGLYVIQGRIAHTS